ncbi:hypothetical protein CMQ_2473 [Grosmannia clavigera kw1407]|uniref:Uncharacterized protein n=1 Tax=Grosmannia clavigera (strain kw1407 / UAMH 11150) TaxID=655863 RepID=F0XIS5_GROCL|nr:uncharacterized protein CMQ_2473 [Grosmannia clavigera kw1407]EFX02424.1 hypothetical protein CMQ_2473 [Grosmannia clavigera kw1407]
MDSRLEASEAEADGRLTAPSHLVDSRSLRPPRLPSSITEHDAGHAAVELASIMTVTSNPVSAGPSSPPLEQDHRPQDFTPPARPSSTPFPQPEYRTDDLRCLSCPANDDAGTAVLDATDPDGCSQTADEMDVDVTTPDLQRLHLGPSEAPAPRRRSVFLHSLPMELQGLILDRVFDGRVTPMTKSSPEKRLTRLACISTVWRVLIQQRLYCRIKLKATSATLSEALIHFAQHPHLSAYVKHVELWFPVFQPKPKPPAVSDTAMLPMVTHEGLSNASYVLPSDNCSLEEAFYFVSSTFADASVLTLEGGERKKAPQVRHFMPGIARSETDPPRTMPAVTTVRTLLCKGQWNLIRSEEDFHNIASALPNMTEWNASYSKPKSKSYLTMASILPNLPASLTSLDVCLESDYRQEISFPPYFLKVSDRVHFCSRLAEATPSLQHLSYTGRVCRSFFDVAARLADPRSTRLRSIDLTVKNCCRHVSHWQESGSGITDLNFIRAFEALVLSAVRSLGRLCKLEHLRIHFPVPPLNPFFLLHNGRASGVWSDTIVAELNRVRPESQWEELSETFGEMTVSKDGRMVINAEFPKKPVVSLKLSNYDYLAALATM